MKRIAAFLLLLVLPGVVRAQEQGMIVEPEPEGTRIQGRIADGTNEQPASTGGTVHFNVLGSNTSRFEVEEPAEQPGLPHPRGRVYMTVELVSDPVMPSAVKPFHARQDVNDPETQLRIEETRERFAETDLLFITAAVDDRNKTLLKVYPGGIAEREVTAISNLNFKDFGGFVTFQVKDSATDGSGEIRGYAMLLALSAAESGEIPAAPRDKGTQAGQALGVPACSEQAFTVMKGDDPEALRAISDLHELYRVEGARMRQARLARETAYLEREAYLMAHPPKPEGVTFRFWKKSSPADAARP